MRHLFFIIKIFNFFLFSTYCFSATAPLPIQNNLPIHFTAGVIEWDQVNHIGLFSGNVSFKQGNTQLFASSGKTTGNDKNQFNEVVLFGEKNKQAHFISTPKDQNEVHAYANKMIYKPAEHLIELYGNVYITQDKYHFRAPYVQYDLEKKKVISKSSSEQQTSIIIEPESKA